MVAKFRNSESIIWVFFEKGRNPKYDIRPFTCNYIECSNGTRCKLINNQSINQIVREINYDE